jgi:hypothetical protein
MNVGAWDERLGATDKLDYRSLILHHVPAYRKLDGKPDRLADLRDTGE